MIKRNEIQYEKEKAAIKKHFRKERRKATVKWIIFEILAVAADFGITKLIFNERYLQWFLVVLFFVIVFPTTLYSKKMKSLSKSEAEQIRLSETNF